MMRLKMLLGMVKRWWKPEHGTVSMWDLIMARLLVKLSTGPIYILSQGVTVMSKIRSVVFETRSRARATISLRTIQQIKPVEWQWTNGPINTGFLAQPVASWSAYNIPNTTTANNMSGFNFVSQQETILTITAEGDVIWKGKPSQAADILVKSFQLAVEDKKGITKSARRRYYWKAVDNLARKSEQMTPEEFVDFVRKQAYNRERKVLVDTLKGNV